MPSFIAASPSSFDARAARRSPDVGPRCRAPKVLRYSIAQGSDNRLFSESESLLDGAAGDRLAVEVVLHGLLDLVVSKLVVHVLEGEPPDLLAVGTVEEDGRDRGD